MDRPIRINYEVGEEITVEYRDFSTYFEPIPTCYINMYVTSSVTNIDVTANLEESFAEDQTIVDSLGDVINLEKEKLEAIIDSFSTLEDTLVALYQQ